MADHRVRHRAADIPHLAAAVAQGLGVGGGSRGSAALADDPVVQAIVEDVRAAGSRAAFVAGPTQPAPVHALCAALNGRYGADAVAYLDTGAEPVPPLAETLPALVRDMAAGRVQMVVMLGTNPVYDLPADLGFAAALARVPLSIHVGTHLDESAALATWHVPRAHYLESWGDGRAWDGTISIIQPLIAPLYEDAHSDLEVLGLLATGQDRPGYALVRETLDGRLGSEDAWRVALHDGFLPGTAYPAVGAAGAAAPDLSGLPVLDPGALELTFRVSPKVHDGRFANNVWMQELPHNVTKLTWDNAAVMSPETARALGVSMRLEEGKRYADRIAITAGETVVTLPVWEQPGHPDGSIQLELGYGRLIETPRQLRDRGLLARLFDRDFDVYFEGAPASTVGEDGGPVGTNVAPLRRLGYPAVLPGGFAVAAAPGDYLLATTQDHGTTAGRDIVRVATVEEYAAAPADAFDEHLLDETPWEAYPPVWTDDRSAMNDPRIGQALYSENQWGMAIDLNTCTGCNACVVACQSENNIPVVGKDEVARGREMHWMRIDRYYTDWGGGEHGDHGGGEVVSDDREFHEPGMVMQPMLCQHCEYAPCESVCPVAATSHSPDGLNEMTYNRCIGTRYCSNNCPYKVRRFNFYNWTKRTPLTVQMAMNPNVTVRFRGVMEKCTYCVQRIRKVQQYAHIEDRPIRDGEVLTACQQACPAEAITFGDISDPGAAVVRTKASPRAYEVLAELNVKPRTSYLARLRNPNPRLAIGSPVDLDPETPAEV